MGAGAAAAAAAIAQATKASGVIVNLQPAEFLKVLSRVAEPLVVTAHGGLFTENFQYLVSYKGLAFFTKSNEVLELPAGVETVLAEKIWIPG
ncbi:MAG: hypothetical protein K2X03_29605 [Bryobacteraceae bacterium]|nr:hypothetical protein [Bryobacteraceae bacterium]